MAGLLLQWLRGVTRSYHRCLSVIFPTVLLSKVLHRKEMFARGSKDHVLSSKTIPFDSTLQGESESEVAQSRLTLCDPMACSLPLPGFSVHGIFQARILEWITIFFSRRSSRPRDWTRSPALQADTLPSESLHSRDCLFLSCGSCPSFPYSFCTNTGTITQNQLTPFRLQFPAKSNSYLWHLSSKAIRVSLRPTKFSLLLTSVLPE